MLDDSDGITLHSLGGVFIATLIGLAVALVTLGVEVALQARYVLGDNPAWAWQQPPPLTWFRPFWQLVGRNWSYLLPGLDGRTSLI